MGGGTGVEVHGKASNRYVRNLGGPGAVGREAVRPGQVENEGGLMPAWESDQFIVVGASG